ncbi:hypothetical protein SKAU_G00317790 [Synaphobranchus kaupii]|uniref:Uncharacterized protein n=1 Tax=Synaphobranchus kaupii TaxID=118154 RepID=A0A9Q1ESY2_SYNKA|nr:hypothetical protein SKAU_G00317790 [Synaphobranchus kaupii]
MNQQRGTEFEGASEWMSKLQEAENRSVNSMWTHRRARPKHRPSAHVPLYPCPHQELRKLLFLPYVL